MINALIIEDIKHYADILQDMLSVYDNINMIGIADNAVLAIQMIKENKPDIVFFDIEMHEENALYILQLTRDFYKYVIFTTSHDEYSLECYQFNALGYLLKPISKNNLHTVLEKAFNYYFTDQQQNKLIDRIEKIDFVKGSKIFLLDKNLYHAVEVDDILYIASNGSYTDVYLFNQKFKLSKSLKSVQEELEKFTQFFRIHKSYIVNTNHILKLNKGNQSKVILSDGSALPISYTEKSDLFLKLGIN